MCNSVHYYIYKYICGYISIIEIYYYYYYNNNGVGKLFRINLISERRAAAVRLPEKNRRKLI